MDPAIHPEKGQYVRAQGEPTQPSRVTGRHRDKRHMPAPYALGVTVLALLSAFGAGAALLPARFTGAGTAAEEPAAAVAALTRGTEGGAPGVGGAAPGTTTSPATSPSATASAPATALPSPTASATASAQAKPPAGGQPSASRTPSRKPSSKAATPARTTVRSEPVTGLAAQEDEVIRLTNVERDKAGCGPVELNPKLRTAMRLHVEELGTHGDLYLSHVSDDGRTFVDRARAQGYDAAGGENVARGQRDAAAVMDSWMNSEGHRANILNCGFKAIGVGAVKGVDNTIVWGQLFGRS